jgi:hypothetical protein
MLKSAVSLIVLVGVTMSASLAQVAPFQATPLPIQRAGEIPETNHGFATINYPANRSTLSVVRAMRVGTSLRDLFTNATGIRVVTTEVKSYGDFVNSKQNPGGVRVDTAPGRVVLVLSGQIVRPLQLGRRTWNRGTVMWVVDAASGDILSIHSKV